MKASKRLSDYIAIKVDSKIPIISVYETEQSINKLITVLNKEFAEEISALRDEFLKKAEEEHPQLKRLMRKSINEHYLYTVQGSDFEKYSRDLERKEHYKRMAVKERVLLRIELSSEELSLDDIDLIIEAEIAKVTSSSAES